MYESSFTSSQSPLSEAGPKSAPKLLRSLVRLKQQPIVQLGLQIDQTGSSERFQIGIRTLVHQVLEQIEPKTQDLDIWQGVHGDRDFGQDFQLITAGGTADQARQNLSKVTFQGGGDLPEHHLDGIECLLDAVPWIVNPCIARGALIAFLTGDTKPARSGNSAKELGERIHGLGVLFYLVAEPTPTLIELVTAANGEFFQISNSPPPGEISAIATQLCSSIAATVANGGTVPLIS